MVAQQPLIEADIITSKCPKCKKPIEFTPCEHRTNSRCNLLSEYLGTRYMVNPTWCKYHCSGTDEAKQQAMLARKKRNPVQAEQAEYKKELPQSKLDLIRHAGKDAKAVLIYAMKNSGKILANGFAQGERQAICRSCEFNVNDKCTKCGCHIAGVINKTQYAALGCPINKW